MAGQKCPAIFTFMKITVEFEDNTSFTAEEAIASNKHAFGNNTVVKTGPRNSTPEAHIYYAVQNLITQDQIEAYFELYPHLYPQKLEEIKSNLLVTISDIIDSVIEDNEKKVE